MTGTDLCVNKPHQSRSYLNHLVYVSYDNKHLLYSGISVWFVLMLSSLRRELLRCVKKFRLFYGII